MAPSTRPKLLELPAELRNRIYTEVFADSTITVQDGRPPFKIATPTPGSLLVCHKIHDEAIGVYYSLSAFTSMYYLTLRTWLGGLPSQYLALLTCVRHVNTPTRGDRSQAYSLRLVMELAQAVLENSMRDLHPAGKAVLQRSGALKVMFQLGDSQVEWTSTPLVAPIVTGG